MVLRHPTLAAKTNTRRGWGTRTLYLKEKCFSNAFAAQAGRLGKMHLSIIVRRRSKMICKQLSLLQTLTPLALHFEFCKRLQYSKFAVGAILDRDSMPRCRSRSPLSWRFVVSHICRTVRGRYGAPGTRHKLRRSFVCSGFTLNAKSATSNEVALCDLCPDHWPPNMITGLQII
jgi:hypothetical protein